MQDEIISKNNTWHFNWVKALIKSGLEVKVFHHSMYGKKIREYLHIYGFAIISVPAILPLKFDYSFKLFKALKEYKPDLIFTVSHFMSPIIDMYDLLVFYSRMKKIPLVTRNAHSDTYSLIFPDTKRKKKNFFYEVLRFFYVLLKFSIKSHLKFQVKKLSLKRTDLIISQTQLDYDNLINKFKINEKNLKLMFAKPIDLEIFKELPKKEAASKLGLSPDKDYILHVSNLFDTKGCEHIINILPDLIKLKSNIHLMVLGSGPKMIFLKNLAKELNVINEISFLGHISHQDISYYYSVSSVLVLPTELLAEGQPNVIIEAIACNLFPISSNILGPASIIKDGLGLLVNPLNYEELKTAILRVLNKEIGFNQNERKKFLNEYSLDNFGKEMNKLLNNLIEYNNFTDK